MQAKQDKKGVFFTLETPIKQHVDRYVFEQEISGKLKGGLSGLIRKLLIRETKFKESS